MFGGRGSKKEKETSKQLSRTPSVEACPCHHTTAQASKSVGSQWPLLLFSCSSAGLWGLTCTRDRARIFKIGANDKKNQWRAQRSKQDLSAKTLVMGNYWPGDLQRKEFFACFLCDLFPSQREAKLTFKTQDWPQLKESLTGCGVLQASLSAAPNPAHARMSSHECRTDVCWDLPVSPWCLLPTEVTFRKDFLPIVLKQAVLRYKKTSGLVWEVAPALWQFFPISVYLHIVYTI